MKKVKKQVKDITIFDAILNNVIACLYHTKEFILEAFEGFKDFSLYLIEIIIVLLIPVWIIPFVVWHAIQGAIVIIKAKKRNPYMEVNIITLIKEEMK